MSSEKKIQDKYWISWLKEELLARGIKTEAPLMPNPWAPDYEKYKVEFEKYEVGENTILVGHSLWFLFFSSLAWRNKEKDFQAYPCCSLENCQ